MNAVLEQITRAVERAVEGAVTHRESAPVVETFRGQTVWEGTVEVFDVATPPPAVAYGWAVESDQGPQYVAVLGKPPVESPITAVRAWIVSQSKK
jgi:hypothetical protein